MGGAGHVRAGSGSSIEIVFYYRGERCRERVRLKPTPANLKRAALHLYEINEAILNGTFDYAVTFPDSPRAAKFCPDVGLTVEGWMVRWLQSKKPILKSSTLTGYQKIINGHIIPALGSIRLVDLKRRDVRDWVSGLSCSNKRIANILSPLRAALQDAMNDELIKENPLYNWTYKRNEPPKQSDVDPFTREEQAAILDALDGQNKNLVQFAFWSGLRTSELIALEWDDVDWNRGEIRVQRAKTQTAKEAETTKTKAGSRDVKLLSPALFALNDQKSFTFLNGRQVFFNPRTNQPWAGDQPIRRTMWGYALKKAGVRYRRPYQTRHTYASMMLSAGEPLAWVSKQMGHSSILMTARVYARWIPNSNLEAGNGAVNLFFLIPKKTGKKRENRGEKCWLKCWLGGRNQAHFKPT